MNRILFPVILAASLGLSSGPLRAEPVIHVFGVFCNAYPGQSGSINQSVSTDQFLIQEIFTQHIPEEGWGVRVNFVEIAGQDARKDNVQRRFAEMARSVRAEDTVYVHFSGHGIIPDPAAGTQYLQTCDLQAINRDDWAEDIGKLPCRLKILVTDCCSSYPPDAIMAEGGDEVEPWETLYFLLRRHEGFVNITAASPGQAAYGTPYGGYLTVNLHSDMQRFRTWEEVFQSTQARVLEETAAEARNPANTGMKPQRPLAYSLGGRNAIPAGEARENLPAAVAHVFPDSATRKLAREEVEALGLQQLYFARNEIMARHGFDFESPLLQRYFRSRAWYQAKPGFKTPRLSETEKANAELILEVETEKGGPFVTVTPMVVGARSAAGAEAETPDIFPYSSERPLTRSVVQSLSPRDLALARNEIFARHGFPFKAEELREHFARKPWYRPDPGVTQPTLNAVEKQNIWLIEKIERINGGPHRF